MDKSVTKELKLLPLDEAFPKSCGRINVWGYDTAMPRDELLSALRKHFASCGQITDVHVKMDSRYEDSIIWRCASIYFLGESAVGNALKLDRSDVGGWKVHVRDYPFMSDLTNSAIVSLTGENAALKALKLNGKRKLVVQLLSGTTFHRSELGGIICGRRQYPLWKKAKISTAE